jgi:proteasome lid subunit RPN8/RPN11
VTRAPHIAAGAVAAISDAVLAAIYAHARAAYPAECCGYVRTGDEVIACANAQAAGENPFAPDRGTDSGFAIAGAELLAFARTFDTSRPARVVYHSHPNGRAYFSEIDRAAAATPAGPVYPVQHLVVGVTAAGVTGAALFAWSSEAHDFTEVLRFPP